MHWWVSVRNVDAWRSSISKNYGHRFSRRLVHGVLIITIVVLGLGVYQSPPANNLSPDIRAMLDRISADSLRGHLSFLASDLLEGRNTPSPGLDIAAEYIAAQFRRAGLDPAGDSGYFQTANWLFAVPEADGFALTIEAGGQGVTIDIGQVSLDLAQGMELMSVPIVKVNFRDAEALAALQSDEIAGKIILTELPDFRRVERSQRFQAFRERNEFMSRMRTLNAALVVSVDRVSATGAGLGSGRLIDPENPRARTASQNTPVMTIHHPEIVKIYDGMKPGSTTAMLSLRVAAPVEKEIRLRNVVGLLRGSDPVLKETYVLVTAHYDHVGVQGVGDGDRIYNGANDDGSGTVSVIELASALASRQERPKRSIVFMTVFGEEKGLLGSRYYGRHPIFPIEKTVANINIEQVGRTDSTEGPQVSNATLTGFDYSDIGDTFKAAGELTGIRLYKHERNSDAYFGRSDNQALADQGVPAHTLCVAFDYPDYHGAGDHWEKIDYQNMAKVNRMTAVALMMIADNPQEPKWNEADPRTERYVKAWRERRGR